MDQSRFDARLAALEKLRQSRIAAVEVKDTSRLIREIENAILTLGDMMDDTRAGKPITDWWRYSDILDDLFGVLDYVKKL